MAKIEENYMERLVNSIAKVLVDAIENLTIEDIKMYELGYNKAIDDFVEKLKNELLNDEVEQGLLTRANVGTVMGCATFVAEELKTNTNQN